MEGKTSLTCRRGAGEKVRNLQNRDDRPLGQPNPCRAANDPTNPIGPARFYFKALNF